MFGVLMVCTANICRSPVAQVLMSQCLQGKSATVHSAGTRAIDGHGADPMMQELLAQAQPIELSQEIAGHRSRALMPSMIARYDLILCMEQEHLDWVCKIQPLATGKAKLLGHWNGGQEIADPIGGPEDAYKQAIAEIEINVEQWSNKIIQLGLCA